MPRNKVSGIYAIQNNENGKVYVGKSVDVRGRWCHHRGRLRRGAHKNPHLQAAWNLYGEAVFTLEILARGVREDLPAMERGWMVRLDSFNRDKGYNLDEATPQRYAMSAETKAKIGAANRGKIRTPEMRAHMSTVKKGQGKGRVKSAEEVANIQAAHARRGQDPDKGYAWHKSEEGLKHAREAGQRGAAARWGPDGV